MKNRFTALLLVCASLELGAQSPLTQNPKFDIPIFLADVTSRSFDVTTTNHALKRQGREAILPSFIVDHTAALVGFEAISVGSKMFLQHELIKYNHPRWARAAGVIDFTVVTISDLHNNRIRLPSTPNYPTCGAVIVVVCVPSKPNP